MAWKEEMMDKRDACLERLRGAARAVDDCTDSNICSTRGVSRLTASPSPPYMARMVSTVPTIRSKACFNVSRAVWTASFLVRLACLEATAALSRPRAEGDMARGFSSAEAASRFCRRSADNGDGGRNREGELDVAGVSFASNARRAFERCVRNKETVSDIGIESKRSIPTSVSHVSWL